MRPPTGGSAGSTSETVPLPRFAYNRVEYTFLDASILSCKPTQTGQCLQQKTNVKQLLKNSSLAQGTLQYRGQVVDTYPGSLPCSTDSIRIHCCLYNGTSQPANTGTLHMKRSVTAANSILTQNCREAKCEAVNQQLSKG